MKVIATMLCCIAFFLLACGSARRSEPIRGPMAITSTTVQNGMKVFMKRCYQCHPGGEGGLGPAINNKPLPGAMIKMQVRKGVGSMPSFSETSISDEQLDQLVE